MPNDRGSAKALFAPDARQTVCEDWQKLQMAQRQAMKILLQDYSCNDMWCSYVVLPVLYPLLSSTVVSEYSSQVAEILLGRFEEIATAFAFMFEILLLQNVGLARAA